MKRFLRFLGIACLVGGWLPTASAQLVSNDNEDEVYKASRFAAREYVPGEVLVKFRDDAPVSVRRAGKKFLSASRDSLTHLLQDFGVEQMDELLPRSYAQSRHRRTPAANGTIIEERDLTQLFHLRFRSQRPDSVMLLVERLKAMDEVEYAEPNYLVFVTGEPISTRPQNNPLYFRQWGITAMNIHKLWDKPLIREKRPVIAILDTGVDITHPDLAANIWTNTAEAEGEAGYDDDGNGIVDDLHGWNFVDNYYDLTDRNSHGTHVAGIAAAVDNGIGIIGANPQALIMPVKVLGDKGSGDVATAARGIVYAAENGADVINMSFGTPTLPSTLKSALDKAYQTSVLVASAGNNGKDIYDDEDPFCSGTSYPAAYNIVLGVEATKSNGQRASFSNYDPDGPIYSEDGIDGRNYELQAPGEGIWSTVPGGDYKQMNGTSMSAPLVSGAISALLMLKEYPTRDVLYGDLIHLGGDFAAIYSDDTPRYPMLDLAAIDFDDAQDGGNADGQVDVGETVRFYPIVRNTWADATDIRLTLSVDEMYADLVEIITPEAEFGYSLSAYGRNRSQNPLQVKFADNIGDGTRIKFHIGIDCTENGTPIDKDVFVTVHNMVKLGGIVTQDMTLTADKNWLVSENLAIANGVTLTIEPGTTVRFAQDVRVSCANDGHIKAVGTPEKPIYFRGYEGGTWAGMVCSDTVSYVHFYDIDRTVLELVSSYNGLGIPRLINCEIVNCYSTYPGGDFRDLIKYNVFHNSHARSGFAANYSVAGSYNTFVNLSCDTNDVGVAYHYYGMLVNNLCYNNVLNNIVYNRYSHFYPVFDVSGSNGDIIHLENLPYMGTGKEEIARPNIYEIGNGDSFVWLDLSNMRKEPYHEAHGIVWKVVVDGKDAQDEFDELAPLGVGRHKFEVWFSRPMNVAVRPSVSMGVREPYTQVAINEDGAWSADSTIYTVYLTINGRTSTDGLNRIYVDGAEDNEYFPCPYEKSRFNVNVQSAGSMATGFAAEAGLGRVELTWNNEGNDITDAMGYNIYRYEQLTDSTTSEAVCLNENIVDLDLESYTDYDVTPGTTYYYYYKVLSTDLREYDISNVVACTPQTAALGDANGSGDVDVADVITTVNYAVGRTPKPFIFEAADVNADAAIDIMDVVGIVKLILNTTGQQTRAEAYSTAVASYTVEDGLLYVDSPVELGGLQAMVKGAEAETILPTTTLEDFETLKAATEEGTTLMAYSMTGRTLPAGRHALFALGSDDAEELLLADSEGRRVLAVREDATGIRTAAPLQFKHPYPNPFTTQLTVPYLIGTAGSHRVSISFHDLAGRTIGRHTTTVTGIGEYSYTWRPAGLAQGIYLVTLSVDGREVHTVKVMKE